MKRQVKVVVLKLIAITHTAGWAGLIQDSFNLPLNIEHLTSGTIIPQTYLFHNFYGLVDNVPLEGNKLLKDINEFYHGQCYLHLHNITHHSTTTTPTSILQPHHTVPEKSGVPCEKGVLSHFTINLKPGIASHKACQQSGLLLW